LFFLAFTKNKFKSLRDERIHHLFTMRWKTCWTTVLCALIATVVTELTTHSFSRNLTIQNALNLKRTPFNKNKPWFLLHVGPPKTATTTLQMELAKLNSSGILKQDNYLYLGRDSRVPDNAPEYGTWLYRLLTNSSCHVLVRAARQHNTTTIYPKCWRKLTRLLHKLSDSGKHVIISDERFGFVDSKLYYDWQAMKDLFLLEENWNFQVIVSYRRYYDWIVSVQSQRNREWGPLRQWPQNEGAPPLPPLYESLQVLMHNPYPYKYLSTSALLHKLNRYNVSSTIFNMHHSGNNNNATLVSTFTCHTLPLAPASCLYTSINATTTAETHSNVALNFYMYDGLVCQAAELGYINTTRYSRPAVAQMAQAFHQNVLHGTKLPLTCPTKLELTPLLQQSMDYEEEILPDFYKSPLGKTTLQDDFWKAVQNDKFCSVNVQAALQQEEWQRFFQTLNNP
jgi:hypothetical protein